MHYPDRSIAPKIELSSKPRLIEPMLIRLSNHNPLYVFESFDSDAVRFDLILDAGSAFQEKRLTAGSTIAMLREGTLTHSGNHINTRIEYHGAYLELKSSKDIAWLSVVCLKRGLSYLLPLIAELFFQPAFAVNAFSLFNRRQKQQFILNSQKNRQLAIRAYNQLVFGAGTRYGQIAEESDFDRLSTADLHSFHSKYYSQAPFTIILSGPVTSSTYSLIDQLFGQHPTETPIVPDGLFVSQAATGLHTVKSEQSLQSAILMGRQLMPRSHPDFFGFLVLNTILGGYFGSRLMSNIREDKGYTYGIYSQVLPLRHVSSFTITTEVGATVTENSLDEIRAEIQKLIESPVDEQELLKVKNFLNGSYLRALDGIYNQAEKFRAVLDLDAKMDYYRQSLEAIAQTRPEDIQRIATQWLQIDEMVTVVVK